ncbi:MAG: hypothetical protein V3S14_15310 [Anaerolineae bacterium]
MRTRSFAARNQVFSISKVEAPLPKAAKPGFWLTFIIITVLLIGTWMAPTGTAAPPAQQATPTYKWTPTPLPTDTPTPLPIATATTAPTPTSAPKQQSVPQPTPVLALLPESGGTPTGLAISSLLLIATALILCIPCLWRWSVKRPY